VVEDACGSLDLSACKGRQTALAEAALDAGQTIVRDELALRYSWPIADLKMSVLALGKLGGGAIDYDSDLDLIFIYDEAADVPSKTSHAEFFGRATELLVTTLSSMTREGSLYRVDLRLRPYGSKGLSSIGASAFLEYIREKAAVWEMLAFVKLRGVAGDLQTAWSVEQAARMIIHERARSIDPDLLRTETIAIRENLEHQRSRGRRSADVDIKYGEGGMLDVYFALRYLQLRWDVRDEGDDRSTLMMLSRLQGHAGAGEGLRSAIGQLADGYRFLSELDHNLRLTVGRTTRIPTGNAVAMNTIAGRMDLASREELVEKLTVHRIEIRAAYERVLDVSEGA
jgi:glutamate-ammonia-ligase adenylyltransferase